MAVGVGVLGVDGLGEGDGHFPEQFLAVFQPFFCESGLPLYFVFQMVLQIFVTEHAPHALAHDVGDERLAHEIGGARDEALCFQLYADVAGQHDDRNVGGLRVVFQYAQYVEPIHDGHAKIKHDEVGFIGSQPRDGFRAGGSGRHVRFVFERP